MNIPKTPKLRGRQQLTLRYKAYEKELSYWQNQRELLSGSVTETARLARFIAARIADCESRLDELKFVMNGVV